MKSELTEALETMFAEAREAQVRKERMQQTLDDVQHELCSYSLRLDKHTAEADAHLNRIYALMFGRDLPRPA